MAAASSQPTAPAALSVVVWGTYDTGKPRVRILLQAARERGIPLREIHSDVWRGVEDKSQIKGLWQRGQYLLRWLCAYPLLLWRYLRAQEHDLVFVPYMGHLDVILIRPFARLRGARVVWDAMLSLHGTLVEDRGMMKDGSVTAAAIKAWDWLAFRCADQLITGTRARAEQYIAQYGIAPERIHPVFISTELALFTAPAEPPGGGREPGRRPSILFYGQFSPLHGLPTVLQAAGSRQGQEWDWLFVGTGQEGWRLQQWLQAQDREHVRWLKWIPYEELPAWIARSDLCLGNFGASQKAVTGIPNKVFQIIACGRALVTADTPAIRELLDPDAPGVYLVPPEDPQALTQLLGDLLAQLPALRENTFHQDLVQQLQPATLGERLAAVFDIALE